MRQLQALKQSLCVAPYTEHILSAVILHDSLFIRASDSSIWGKTVRACGKQNNMMKPIACSA